MNVAFTLVCTATAAPTAALWLPSGTARELLDALCALGHDPVPRAYVLSRGFLIVLDAPDARAMVPGAVRLRALADNFYAPLDAELGVALLDDEAHALTRERGLLLLPNEALEFDFKRPIPLSALLSAAVKRDAWQALPAAPPQADRIESITLNFPDTPDDLLSQGGAGIGDQAPGPNDAKLSDKLKGQTSFSAGKALAGLGNLFGIDAFKRKGAEWMSKGLDAAPSLSEKLMGSQEVALRDLLKKFREGKVDDALKRAIPFNQSGSRGGVATDSPNLPFNNILYSLGNILGGGNRGPSGVWFTNEDVSAALMREYRKAAGEAAKKGDHRRAAFIYGKLLGDYREAAAALLAGGLYHDAAQLYLLKLNDPLAAARAFESAGEIDKAVAIYREKAEHALAGDLLMRSGEEESAVAEFNQAANFMAARGDYFAAGKLMLERAKRRELAEVYYSRGWNEKHSANAPACGQALLELYADDVEPVRLMAHVAEAERFYGPEGHQVNAARFFNRLAELSNHKQFAPVSDELRDRALMALANKIRQRAGYVSNSAISELLAASTWAPALVNDARIAVKHAAERFRDLPTRPHASPLRLGQGRISCLCFAQNTDELFAGFDSGEVVSLRPTDGAVLVLSRKDAMPLSLASTQDGDALFILRAGELNEISSVIRRGSQFEPESPAATTADEALLAAARGGHNTFSLCAKGELLSVRQGLAPALTLEHTRGALSNLTALAAAIVEPTFNRLEATLSLITLSFGDDSLHYYPSLVDDARDDAVLGWHPATPYESLLRTAPISSMRTHHDELELCGTNSRGYVFWTRLLLSERRVERVETKICGARQEYRCACLTRGGHVAAVSESRVDFFARQGGEMILRSSAKAELRGALAAHFARISEEVLVVCEDGRLVRILAGT